MEEVKKALEELSKAIENCDTVEKIKITITIKKPKKK